jgi:hypothetical protein
MSRPPNALANTSAAVPSADGRSTHDRAANLGRTAAITPMPRRHGRDRGHGEITPHPAIRPHEFTTYLST